MPRQHDLATRVDRHVAGRIRERRIMLGLTQQKLAEQVGITYQQLHKYERAINRISAGRLFEVAQLLEAPLSFFYDGFEGPARQPTARQRFVLELARTFGQINDPRLQDALRNLARSLATEAA